MPRLIPALMDPWWKHLIGLAPRAECPYATHLPVLIGLGRVFSFRKVVELGGGVHSTPLLLDPGAYPYVEELVTVEDDPEWAARLVAAHGSDPRWRLLMAPEGVAKAVGSEDLSRFELVLVDDSRSAKDRARTLRTLGGRRNVRAIVVVHDFEERRIRLAAHATFRRTFCFRVMNPQTGVCAVTKDTALEREKLLGITDLIRRHDYVPADNVQEWSQLFAAGI